MKKQKKKPLLYKFNKWLAEDGKDGGEEVWTDYLGGTSQVEWAIDNGKCVGDYDTWQCIQRILKHEMSFDSAMKIDKVLYAEGISPFDCE